MKTPLAFLLASILPIAGLAPSTASADVVLVVGHHHHHHHHHRRWYWHHHHRVYW